MVVDIDDCAKPEENLASLRRHRGSLLTRVRMLRVLPGRVRSLFGRAASSRPSPLYRKSKRVDSYKEPTLLCPEEDFSPLAGLRTGEFRAALRR